MIFAQYPGTSFIPPHVSLCPNMLLLEYRLGSGQLTLREMKRSDLLQALETLDSEDDINKVLKYFSYEHFYVIYCKFWELDSDHDFLIDRSDLAHYSQCALSFGIIDRIFDQVRSSLGHFGNVAMVLNGVSVLLCGRKCRAGREAACDVGVQHSCGRAQGALVQMNSLDCPKLCGLTMISCVGECLMHESLTVNACTCDCRFPASFPATCLARCHTRTLCGSS